MRETIPNVKDQQGGLNRDATGFGQRPMHREAATQRCREQEAWARIIQTSWWRGTNGGSNCELLATFGDRT